MTTVSTLQALLIRVRTDSKFTLKAAVTEFIETTGVEIDAEASRTKAGFVDFVNNHIEYVTSEELVSELDSLKVEITEVIKTAGNAGFELGNLLIKARDAHDNQADFLAWVDDNFAIKKSWAFMLMKIAKVFSGEPWNTVSAQVLYTLQQQGSEDQIEQARKFAEAGKLDLPTLKSLLNHPIPAVKTQVQTKADEQLEKRAADSVINSLIGADVKDVSANLPAAPQAHVAEEKPAEDASGLKLQLSEAMETIRELTAQVAELTKPRLRSSADMPMLPQFTSKNFYVRLGLAAEDYPNKEEILEAFRGLCRAGYGRGHKEAWALLDEARHELVHALETTVCI